MTKDAKVGLLLGLLLIVAIALVLQTLHRGVTPDANELRDLTRPSARDTAIIRQPVERAVRNLTPARPTPMERPMTREDSFGAPQPREETPRQRYVEPMPARSEPAGPARPSAMPTETAAPSPVDDTVRYVCQLPGNEGTCSELPIEPVAVTPPSSQIDRAVARAQALTAQNSPTAPVGPVVAAEFETEPEVAVAAPLVRSVEPVYKRHVVRSGDNLTKIALKYYGAEGRSQGSRDRIFEANRDILSSPDMLRIGQTLNIPTVACEAAVPAAVSVPAEHPISSVAAVVALTDGGQQEQPRTRAGRFHVVEEGESLWTIAATYLGDGRRYPELRDLNKAIVGDEDNVQAGMKLRLPGSAAASTASGKSKKEYKYYTVKEGDNLWGIAKRYLGDGKRYREIIKLNPMTLDRDGAVRPGMRLKLPVTGKKPTATQGSTWRRA